MPSQRALPVRGPAPDGRVALRQARGAADHALLGAHLAPDALLLARALALALDFTRDPARR